MRSAWTAELVKVLTVRGFRAGAVLAGLALPLTSLLVVSSGGLGDADTLTSGAATGSMSSLVAYAAWAAVVAGSEYTQRTIVVSLATVPRRPVLYGAKVAAAATIAAAGAAAGAVVSLLVVAAVTPSGHRLGDPPALLGVVLASGAAAVVGAAIGVLTRSSTGSIAVVIAALLLPRAAAGLLGGLQPWIVGASPGTVVTQFVQGAQLAADQAYPGGAALAAVTMLLVALAVATLGGLAFARRDG